MPSYLQSPPLVRSHRHNVGSPPLVYTQGYRFAIV